MNTKFLYVLVSGSRDIYLEQAYVSIASLRHHMGVEAEIYILTDTLTFDSLDEKRSSMLKGANDIITVDLPADLSAQNRSRILKTSAREYITGDFLFIDCDTIILQPLNEVDNIQADIAACIDSHASFAENPYREMCISHCKIIGKDISSEADYFNSGVIYVKDSPAAHAFYKKWNENWLRGREKGVNMDQPAFNITNIEMGYPIQSLNDIWNCEFIHGIRFLKDAKILHYLTTNSISKKNKASFILKDKDVLLKVKETGVISDEVKICFDDPFKGIPALTSLVAGDEVYLQRSQLYMSLLNKFQFGNFARLTSIFNFLRKLTGRK